MHRRPGANFHDVSSFPASSPEPEISDPWKGAKSSWRAVQRSVLGSPVGVGLLTLLLILIGLYYVLPPGNHRTSSFLSRGRDEESSTGRPSEWSGDREDRTPIVVNEPGDLSSVPGDFTAEATEDLPSSTGTDPAEETETPLLKRPLHSRPERPSRQDVLSSLPPAPPSSPPAKDTIGFAAMPRLVRGAAPATQASYVAEQKRDRFQCFDRSLSFSSFDVVNDDYCDCPDGSDEPGTSACSGAAGLGSSTTPGFFCGWQKVGSKSKLSKVESIMVRSAAVNDGICDCCGGEDEYDGAIACSDRCAEELAAERAEISQGLAGSRARQSYVKEAARLLEEGRYAEFESGGPENVFFAEAAHGCLKKDDGDFTFEVCLFDVAKQHDRSGNHWKLGVKGTWSTHLWEDGKTLRKDFTKLIMDGGDYCFASKAPRRTEIIFECAATSSMVSVQESQVCVYEFHMKTPAACKPLHPDDPDE